MWISAVYDKNCLKQDCFDPYKCSVNISRNWATSQDKPHFADYLLFNEYLLHLLSPSFLTIPLSTKSNNSR